MKTVPTPSSPILRANRTAFTMIEVIFVLVILGILAAIALPKFAGTVEDAYIAKAQAKVSTVRSGIQNYKSKEMLKGNGAVYPASLDSGGKLFGAVATGVDSSTAAGGWSKNSDGQYLFHTGSTTIVFDYNATTGTFSCNTSATFPSSLCNGF